MRSEPPREDSLLPRPIAPGDAGRPPRCNELGGATSRAATFVPCLTPYGDLLESVGMPQGQQPNGGHYSLPSRST